MTEKRSGLGIRLKHKYGILGKAFIGVAIALAAKFLIDQSGLAFIELNNLVTAFLGGVFFTIGILVSGAASDFKEAEKMPGDLAATFRTLRGDAGVIPMDPSDKKTIDRLDSHIKELLHTINENFRKEGWKLKEINAAITVINEDISELARKGAAPNFMIKLRSEVSAIDKMAHRIDTIIETSFIPAAYAIAELAIGSVILLLMFTKIGTAQGGLLVFGVISAVLLGLTFLIRDMDNPFETGKNSYADVSVEMLYNLEKYWEGQK